jgi:hypothetical protein
MMSDDAFLRQTGKTDKSRAGKPAMLYSPLPTDPETIDESN